MTGSHFKTAINSDSYLNRKHVVRIYQHKLLRSYCNKSVINNKKNKKTQLLFLPHLTMGFYDPNKIFHSIEHISHQCLSKIINNYIHCYSDWQAHDLNKRSSSKFQGYQV